jgi:hypothetical protein
MNTAVSIFFILIGILMVVFRDRLVPVFIKLQCWAAQLGPNRFFFRPNIEPSHVRNGIAILGVSYIFSGIVIYFVYYLILYLKHPV